jgi:hypothetical protein
MASLYKKPINMTDPKTGKKIKSKSKKWWGRYRDEYGAEKRVPLATDKTAAQAMLNELVKKAEQRASGVIDRFDEHRKRPIADHVADFENHMKTKGNSPEQVKLVAARDEFWLLARFRSSPTSPQAAFRHTLQIFAKRKTGALRPATITFGPSSSSRAGSSKIGGRATTRWRTWRCSTSQPIAGTTVVRFPSKNFLRSCTPRIRGRLFGA